jgi:flavin reductase (DIM6/NTAB) family NADH-FMN oxidoreductase RutF
MFYNVDQGHGLRHDPLRAIIAPRPIAWISTADRAGRANLAPYSFFNVFSAAPPIVGFSSEGQKDSLANIRDTGEFVVNLATRALADQMNETSRAVPRGTDEMAMTGLDGAASHNVTPRRLRDTPAALESKLLQTIELKDLRGVTADRWLTLGQVIGVYINDAFIKDGLFDLAAARVIARCGYFDYAEISELFQMRRPEPVPNH